MWLPRPQLLLLQDIALDEIFSRAFELCCSEVGAQFLLYIKPKSAPDVMILNPQIEQLVDESTAGADA